MANNKKGPATGKGGANNVKQKAIATAKSTGWDILCGVLGGGAAAAICPNSKVALLVGLGVNATGHYFGSPQAAAFGMGMMASGVHQSIGAKPVSGTDTDLLGLDGVQERLVAFGKDVAQKFWLDTVIPSLKESKPVSGLGEVQYFVYPNQNPVGELDMSALERLEVAVANSGQQFTNRPGVSGFSGIGDVTGIQGLAGGIIY